jgi:hypothetical protein
MFNKKTVLATTISMQAAINPAFNGCLLGRVRNFILKSIACRVIEAADKRITVAFSASFSIDKTANVPGGVN